MDANGREIERDREARAEAQRRGGAEARSYMSRRRLLGKRKIRSSFIFHDLQSTICDHFVQRSLWKNMKRSLPI
jgi:hypothetical protein